MIRWYMTLAMMMVWIPLAAAAAPPPRIVRSLRVDVYEDGTARIDTHSRPQAERPPRPYRDDHVPAKDVEAIVTEFAKNPDALAAREPMQFKKAADVAAKAEAVEALKDGGPGKAAPAVQVK